MKVMAIAVHPDDETLGCGGTLLKHMMAGDSLHWVIATEMNPNDYSSAARARQQQQVDDVYKSYPFSTLDWLRLPTTRIETLSLNGIIGELESSIDRIRPDIVYAPFYGDSHSDHRVIFDALMGILRPTYMLPRGVRKVLSCEVMSETEAATPGVRPAFVPNLFVDISATIERKLELFSLYQTEVHPEPGPRSLSAIRAQARFRGATIGVPYAESFVTLREIA